MKRPSMYFAFCPTSSMQRRAWILRAVSNSGQVGVHPSPRPHMPTISMTSPSPRPVLQDHLAQQQQRRLVDPDNHGAIIESCEADARPTSASRGGSRGRSNSLDLYQFRGKIAAAGRQRKWTEVLRLLGHWEQQHQSKKLDAKTYNFALSALRKCGRWREAIAMLNRMRDTGVPPDAYSWNTAISACGRAGQWEQALRLLGNMEEEGSEARPDIFSYNGAIDAVAKAGRWTEALELLERMDVRGLTPDVISFTSAMSACNRAGEWQRALDIMYVMLERHVEPSIVSYGTAISACARGGCWQKALCLLREIPSRGLVANAHVYGSAMHACVKGGEHERALSLLGEMVEVGVVPDAVAFTAAMTAVDGWAAALRLLEMMKRAGVAPDTTAYNAALSVIARGGREDVALALLEKMRADGCSPDLVSFNTVIDACASRGKWQEAARLLEVEMPAAKVKPDVISFASAIHACSGPAGNWEKAYQLLDGMWQDDTGPKPNKRTYDLVIQACGHGGEWELGVALVDDMRDLGMKLDVQTFNIAAAACARAGERLAAETVVVSMRRSGIAPDEFSYASLVAACGRSGEWERAVEIFDEARYVRRVRPSLPMYGALLSALADAKQWTKVLLYWDRMAADGIVPDATAACKGALAAAELGDGHRALSLLEGKPPQRVRGNTFGASEARASGHLAEETPSGATSNGDGERGTGSEGGSVPGGWGAATPGLLNAVLHALDRMGEDATVLETVERGREKGIKLNAGVYRSALKACGNLGDHSRASSLLARIVEKERLTPDVIHWNHALRAAAVTSRWREARALLEEMKVSDVSPDEFSYTMALKACSASRWPGDSWSSGSGWLTQEDEEDKGHTEEASAVVTHGAEANSSTGQESGVLPASRARNAVELLPELPAKQLLQEMRRVGLRVSERSFNLAMAACLEGHRDGPTEAGPKPTEGDLRLAMTALRLFDQLVETGETPTGLTYALALKACQRTANKHRASQLRVDMYHASTRVAR